MKKTFNCKKTDSLNKEFFTQPYSEEFSNYKNLKENDVSSERSLWQSVIMQAIFDIITPPKNMNDRINRAKTVAWFSGSSA